MSSTRVPSLDLRTPTGSIIPHIALWTIHPVSPNSPLFPGRRSFFALAIIILAVLSQVNTYFTSDIALAQPFTIGWSVYLSTLEKILFAAGPGPEASFWHIDKPMREALLYPGFGFRKLKWALVLMLNMRGIRWKYQVKNVPKQKPPGGKWSFVCSQILSAVYDLLVVDLVVQLGIHFFYATPDGQIGALNSKYLTLRHPDWRWSFVKALEFGATPYYICCLQYNMGSVPAVALGLSKPEDRPPYFGSIADAKMVRAFWGVY